MRHKLPLLLCALTLAGLAGYVTTATAASEVKLGSNAPRFSLTDQDGRNVTLSEFSGKIVVLEFINPACPLVERNYAAEVSQKLAEKYKEKDVVWLAINSSKNGDNQRNKAWREEHKVPFQVLNDANGEIAKAYGADVPPHLFVVDKNGNVAYMGGMDNDDSPKGEKGEGKENYVDRALGEMTTGNAVSKPEAPLYRCNIKVTQ